MKFFSVFLLKMCLVYAVYFTVIPSASAVKLYSTDRCVLSQRGAESASAKFPDHPTRMGYYLYYLDSRSDKMGYQPEACRPNRDKVKPIWDQMKKAFNAFGGCENKTGTSPGPCDNNSNASTWHEGQFNSSDSISEACGTSNVLAKMQLGHYYYCAGGGMMERTDFIPVKGCHRNSYASTMNCQPCPLGTYSKRGATSKSQCIDKKQNESVFANSKMNFKGELSCPSNANVKDSGNDAGECICNKGTNWSKKSKKCK